MGWLGMPAADVEAAANREHCSHWNNMFLSFISFIGLLILLFSFQNSQPALLSLLSECCELLRPMISWGSFSWCQSLSALAGCFPVLHNCARQVSVPSCLTPGAVHDRHRPCTKTRFNPTRLWQAMMWRRRKPLNL
jgi:hypothetical protein